MTAAVEEPFEELIKRYPNVDPFLLKKWERVFNVFFDRNASHEVDWADFYIVIRQVREIYGAESEQMVYARQSMKALWEGLCQEADKDHDQLISLDEWIQLLLTATESNQQQLKWFDQYLIFMFKLFDVSADDFVDIAEYVDGMRAYGQTETECRQAFASFAVDNRGHAVAKLDKDMWRQLYYQYYFSKDKQQPGNHLFGKLDV